MTDDQYRVCELIEEAELIVEEHYDFLLEISRAYIRGEYHMWSRQRDLILGAPEREWFTLNDPLGEKHEGER